MGVTFSPDSRRVYLSGGENGNIWIADAFAGQILGSVNLNGPTHPLDRPLDVVATPQGRFKGAFPGNMALGSQGRYLYVVDQGSFQVHVIDVSKISRASMRRGASTSPTTSRRWSVMSRSDAILSGSRCRADDRRLFVTHVGVFQYTHLRPATPTGDGNFDYPLCYPGAGYPDETRNDRVIEINKVDPRNLPE